MAGVHEDFGEKIGGAKKDLWKDRGLYADDLEAMNEREAEKFVKKDNVWKKPDYAAMLEEGIPLGVVYFIKKARDGLNASPQYYRTDDTPEKRTARQKEYIKTVRGLQTVLSDVRTVEDAMRAYDRFFVDNGYLEKVQGWVSDLAEKKFVLAGGGTLVCPILTSGGYGADIYYQGTKALTYLGSGYGWACERTPAEREKEKEFYGIYFNEYHTIKNDQQSELEKLPDYLEENPSFDMKA